MKKGKTINVGDLKLQLKRNSKISNFVDKVLSGNQNGEGRRTTLKTLVDSISKKDQSPGRRASMAIQNTTASSQFVNQRRNSTAMVLYGSQSSKQSQIVNFRDSAAVGETPYLPKLAELDSGNSTQLSRSERD